MPNEDSVATTRRFVSSLRMKAGTRNGGADAVVVDLGALALDSLDLSHNQIEEVYLALVAPFLISHGQAGEDPRGPMAIIVDNESLSFPVDLAVSLIVRWVDKALWLDVTGC